MLDSSGVDFVFQPAKVKPVFVNVFAGSSNSSFSVFVMLSIEPLPPFALNATVKVSGSLVVILQLKSETAKTHANAIRATWGGGKMFTVIFH